MVRLKVHRFSVGFYSQLRTSLSIYGFVRLRVRVMVGYCDNLSG